MSSLSSIGVAQRAADLLTGKAPVVEKAGLASMLSGSHGRLGTDAFRPCLKRALIPFGDLANDGAGNEAMLDPVLLELLRDPYRIVTRFGTLPDITLSGARVARKALRCTLIEHAGPDDARLAVALELIEQLGTRMFTPRQEIDSAPLDLAPRATQTVTSSTERFSDAAGKVFARMPASISAAFSGCSLRKIRALSLPWPMCSPW